jgi:hypothetical protein
MQKHTLNISTDLQLPQEVGTETIAILGRRGSGKSNTATVIAEELIRAGQQVVVIDPKGEAWGLKAQGDGGPGLDVIVFGDPQGDLPLRDEHGPVVADFVVSGGKSCVLSVKGLVSDAAQRRFVARFAERLFELKGRPGNSSPLMVIIDEAHLFVPQRIDPGQADVVSRLQRLVRLGRSSGIGVTLVDQRPASVNKDVLTQLEVMICHQLTGPHDRRAVDDWIEANADREQAAEFRRSLPTLDRGEAWVWSPALLKVFKRVKVRHRDTFDSSATPVLGERGVKPPKMRPVNLDELRGQLDAVVEEAKASDPAELRKRLAAADRELVALRAAKVTPAVRLEARVVERPVLKEGQLARAEKLQTATLDLYERLVATAEKLIEASGPVEAATKAVAGWAPPVVAAPPVRPHPAPARPSSTPEANAMGRDALSGPHRKILDAVAWWDGVGVADPSPVQVGLVSGYVASGGSFGTYLSALSSAGLVRRDRGTITMTDAGAAVAKRPAATPTLADLHERIRAVLSGPHRKLLDAVIDAGPAGLTNDELGERTGYAPSGGSFGTYLSKLSSLGLVNRGRGHVSPTAVVFPPTLMGDGQ